MYHYAHRGYSALYPENSLEAFRAALSVADGIECDLWLTSDGVWIIHHNNYIVGGGLVREATYAKLKMVNPGICRLEQLLQLVNGAIPIFLELKGKIGRPEAESLSKRLVNYSGGNYYVGGFNSENLWYLTLYFPREKLVYNTCDGDVSDGLIGMVGVIAISCEGFHVDLVSRCTSRQVWVYTVNDPHNYSRCQQSGVTAIITDDPSLKFMDGDM